MVRFNELQKDALCEIFNISVSQAAGALSEILQQKIRLTVPSVEICDTKTVVEYIDQTNDICGISQRFQSDFDGHAVLIFPENRSLELVRLMVGIDVPLDQLTEMEQDALGEIGNIVLNSCLASLSDMFDQQFECGIPQLIIGNSHSVLSGYSDNSVLILLQIKFIVGEDELEGHILFVVNAQSLGSLLTSINKFLSGIN
jgi:chemotaxis protein CheC